ncbi:MAG: tyrosine-type recombinase/integrase [Candidatus Acidiferrales bacterium]
MAYFTGMRRGEILNLRWDNVNLKDAIVRLDPGTTKNNQPRTIPLSGELLEILKMHELERTSEFVFFRRGRRVDIRAAWEQACVRAGLGRLKPGPDGGSITRGSYFTICGARACAI